ncbi:MAG: DUF58 domain-containing protein [Chloroflexi bacterium]|nr:MAG: DUF58 domain-containing protein [Chloroflexota bacterium]
MFIASILLPDRVWYTLLIGIGGLFVVSYVWIRQLAKGVHATRRLRYGWVSVGDRLEEQFTIINTSLLPALWVEVVDQSNVPEYKTAVVHSVANEGVRRWREYAVCLQRGQYQLGPWTIRSSDPFGIFILTRQYPVSNEVIIHPPIHTEIPIPLPSGQSSGRVRARQRAWRATINAASVRDYQPNDPYRWIHWPTSARRDELFVRQFDLDAAGDIWILLDMEQQIQLGDGLDGTEEHAVLLAASLAAMALHQNRPVGVAGYGRSPQIVPPGRGTGHRWKILRALALVNADGDATLSQTITDISRLMRRGSAAVIITATNSIEWLPNLTTLSQRGLRSELIVLDRPSFGGTGKSQVLQDALLQQGYSCHIIRQGEIGQAPEQEKRGYWEFKVTGTGGVVAVQSPVQQT